MMMISEHDIKNVTAELKAVPSDAFSYCFVQLLARCKIHAVIKVNNFEEK
jgi:hypothetical protein